MNFATFKRFRTKNCDNKNGFKDISEAITIFSGSKMTKKL